MEENKEQLPSIDFNIDKKEEENKKEVIVKENKANELVENSFNQAVVYKVQSDKKVQEQLLETASQVIENKVEAIKNEADTESKKAHFNNKKNACECFGYNEETTEKWAVNWMNLIHNVLTGIWIVLGSFTFAPITFVCKKIKVIIKASWAAVLLAIIIYLLITFSPIWIKWITELKGTGGI